MKENNATTTEVNNGIGLLKNLGRTIKSSIESSADKERFLYAVTEIRRKLNQGCLVLNVRITDKENGNQWKHLFFVLTYDNKTGWVHSFIMDGDLTAPNVLFFNTSTNPASKLERYLPSIIRSTEMMIIGK